MNSTKKVLKGNTVEKKQSKKPQEQGGKKGTTMLAILTSLVVLMCGYIAWESLHPKLILTINGEKTYLEDMNYQIMQAEKLHNSIAAIYAQMGYAQSYWDMEQDGVSTQKSVRDEIINAEIEQQLLYAEAEKNGYTATDEEKEKALASAKELLEDLSDEKKEKTGFTEENLTEAYTKDAVVARYKQDLIDSFDIDDEEIKAGVDKEQYREYVAQCFYVANTDEEGNELSAAKLEEAKAALIKEADAAKSVEDWSKVLDEEAENQVVSYESVSFIKEDTNYDEAVMAKAMTMENGEISEVVEGEDGYYIIKMKDNNSSARYEEAVKEAISTVENQKFDEKYLAIYETYDVQINEREWKKVVVGNITI